MITASRGDGKFDVKFDKPIDDTELCIDRCFIATKEDLDRRERDRATVEQL